MTLKQYQQLLKLDPNDLAGQLQILNKDISKLTVKQMSSLLEKELKIDYTPKYSRVFKKNGRRFKVVFNIEELNAGEYGYFKQVLGDITAGFVDVDDKIVEKTEKERAERLFQVAHKVVSVFLKEKTWFKRHLSFNEKQQFLLNCDLNDIVQLTFFLLKRIELLQRNTTIYYLNQLNLVKNPKTNPRGLL